VPRLSSLSVPYGTLAHQFIVVLLVQTVLNRIFIVSYFTTPPLLSLASPLFCVYVHLLCISCHMEKILLCFINSSLVRLSVCSLATSESLDVLSEDGTFQVFLERMLGTVLQRLRLRLSMSQTDVQLSPRCHFLRTRCETLRCFWEKYLFLLTIQ